MRVSFVRTGDRRYAVEVERERATDLIMDPAPGFSDRLPHDLVHLVVEKEFDLRDGIFGQLAAGGNAGTFVPTQELRTKSWGRKVARRNKSTGRDMDRSEELAAAIFPAWSSPSPERSHILTADLDPARVAASFASLDRLSREWQDLEVGGRVVVDWPWPESAR